jgi:PST family polysaccharide transporter
LVTIVLARVLGPEEFGVAAMVIVLSTLAIPLADFGLGVALIQRERLTEADRSTVFWASVGLGTAFTVAGVAASPIVGHFYHQHSVTPLFAVMSTTFLLTGLGCTQRSLLARAMDFKSLELRLIAGNIIGAIAGVALALEGFGAWAIVAQSLVSSFASLLLLWILTPWRPRLMFSATSLRSMVGFGTRYVGASTFKTASQNLDNVLVGHYLGAAALGLYALAYSVILVPISRIVSPFQQVVSPAFLRLQGAHDGMGRAWLRGTRVLAGCCIPLMLLIAVVAPDLVPALFGARWARSVPVLQILAWVSLLQLVQTLHAPVLVATHGMRLYFRFNLVSLAVSVASFWLGIRWGIEGVAASYAVVSTALAIALTWLTARSVQVPFRKAMSCFGGLWQPAVALVVAGMVVSRLSPLASSGPWVRMIVVGAVAATAYALTAAISAPDFLREIREVSMRVLRPVRRPVERVASQP